MKVLQQSLLGLAASAICGAAAAQAVNQRVAVSLTDATRPATLHVALIRGSISVHGAERKDVLIEARSGSDAPAEKDDADKGKANASGLKRIPQPAALTVEEQNNRVEVSAGMPNQPYDFDIQVPVNTNLEISTINSGQIVVDGVNGQLEIGNVNGAITLTRVGGSVVAHTTNGGVHATLTRVTPQAPMAFTTLNGDVDVTFPATTKANLKLRSDQGQIFTDFDFKVTPESAAPKIEDTRQAGGRYRIEINKALFGAINGGGPDFEMRSFAGNVYVRKEGK